MGLTDNPKISIILPSLNVAAYISECVESVVAQSMEDIEIICVDGGSTDGTLEILEKYAANDQRVNIIHSRIKSYGYQVNLGIKAARGEYIGIVETDDYISYDMYGRLYSYVIGTNADFIKGGFVSFFEFNGERSYIPHLNDQCKALSDKCIDLTQNRQAGLYDPVHIWAAIYRRDFLLEKEIWFNETPGASYQDTSFSILVGLLADSCIYSDACSYYYRIDNINSSVKSDNKLECVRDEYAYIDSYLNKHGGISADERIWIDKYKLTTYKWNYDRLSEQGREQFTKAISEEMDMYLSGGIYADILNDQEKEYVKILTDEQYAESVLQKENEAEKRYQALFQKILEGMQFIIVGAGKYLEILLSIKEMVRKNFILEVSDNNTALQGTEKDGYHIVSVEEAIRENTGAGWIIANKNHSAEIEMQLKAYGVEPDKIYVINRFIGEDRLLKVIRSCTDI